MASESPNIIRENIDPDELSASWWKLPAACALVLVMMACCSFVWTVQYVQLLMFTGDSLASRAIAPIVLLALLGLGSLLGGILVQSSKTPMLYMARLALAGAIVSALSFIWMIPVKSVYYFLGGWGQSLPGGTILVNLFTDALAFLPVALLGGAIIPAAISLAGKEHKSAGMIHASWLPGIGLGTVCGFGLYLTLTGGGLWVPSVLFLATAIAANNLARISPVIIPEKAEPLLVYREQLPVLVSGFTMSVLAWCLIRVLHPLLGSGLFTSLIIIFCMLVGAACGGILSSLRGDRSLTSIAASLCLAVFWLALTWASGDKMVILYDALAPFRALGMPLFYTFQFLFCSFLILPVGAATGFLVCGLRSFGGSPAREGKAASLFAWGACLGILVPTGLSHLGLAGFEILWFICVKMVLVAVSLAMYQIFRKTAKIASVLILSTCFICIFMLRYPGPSVIWTQHNIVQGNSNVAGKDFNSVLDWMRSMRRQVVWENSGINGSTALFLENSPSLVENGLIRASLRQDAARDVMAGLVPAALHPDPDRALLLGLGTGCTAGWLARVDSIRQVDVLEENPLCVEAANGFSLANFQALKNPKVRVRVADFRPAIFFENQKYDLIIQDGMAAPLATHPGLYTAEFFKQVAARLNKNGLFNLSVSIQGMDPIAMQSIYGALGEAFPHVHTFRPQPESLYLVCSADKLAFREDFLNARLATEPYATAMEKTWGVSGLEGFFSRYLAGPGFSRMLAGMSVWNHIINQDNRPQAYAIMVGTKGCLNPGKVLSMKDAEERDHYRRPFFNQGRLDLIKSQKWQVEMFVLEDSPDIAPELFSPNMEPLVMACQAFQQGRYLLFLNRWDSLKIKPESPLELAMAAYALAMEANEGALQYSARLEKSWPEAAQICMARYYWNTDQRTGAMEYLERGLSGFANDPWVWPKAVEWGLGLAAEISSKDRSLATRILTMVSSPFCLMQSEEMRLKTQLAVAENVGLNQTIATMDSYGPFHPWTRDFLYKRLDAFQAAGDPRAPRALADMQAYLLNTQAKLSDVLAEN